MAIRRPQITTAQWLRRTLLIWFIELVAVVMVAAAIGGVQLAGIWPAVQFTAFVGWDAIVSIAPILYITGIALACLAAFLTLRKYLRV